MTEFDDVIRRLEDGRPQATAQELDAIKQRVRRRAAEPSRRSQSMKSRLAILGMLVTGMLFSTAGAGLAVSGLNKQASNNAAISQYVTTTPTPSGETGVQPAEAENAPAPAAESEGGVLPAEETQAATQPERQTAAPAEASQLPFTGFAAIPVLLGGLALLTGGLILRRRTREH